MMDKRLALIVGANRGIGLGVAEAFLAAGWDVIATARKPDQATALRALGDRVTILPLDMAVPAALDGFGAALGDPLGGRMLDAALINAGVAGPDHRSANAATTEEIGALMFVNAVAPIRLARQIVPHLRPGPGVLAFQSSVMGSVAMNSGGGHELYRASKAALNSMTRGLWGELRGKQLTVLSLHPGWVRTDMGGRGAPVSVDDSARGIVRVIEAQSGAHQHRYLDYNGAEIAW